MKENKKEEKPIKAKFNISKSRQCRNNETKDKRTRSACLNYNLYNKFIPTLKPIDANINPSPIKLTGKEDLYISVDNFSIKTRKKFLDIEESIKEKAVNSTDEDCNCKLSYIVSDSSEDSKDNDNKNVIKNKNSLDNDENMSNIKKKELYCISHIRKKMSGIKNQIESKKYKDDFTFNKSYNNYYSGNYRIKCAQNYIDKLKLESMNEFNKYKNRTISFNESKRNKPPILGFLQMNEVSAISNSTLSSCNLSEI